MKILFITSRFPYPLEKGDKLRAYHLIKNLSRNNEIVLFALSDRRISAEELEKVKEICPKTEAFFLSRFSIIRNMVRSIFTRLPIQVGYFYSEKAFAKLSELVKREKPDHMICQLVRTSEYGKCFEKEKKTLDYMDAFSKGVERRLLKAPFYKRPAYYMEYRRLEAYEREIFDSFRNKIIISAQDRNYINHPERDKIVVISNGVDTGYFSRSEPEVPPKKEFDILFNGNMNYPPNIESAEYLVRQILPLVRKKHASVRTLISGADPDARIKELQSENVKISGWVEDIRVNFAKSKMLVAPMFLSIGLQNKLMEAMAMQIPCITSTLANNALGAVNGKDILIADTPEEFAEQITRLLDDEKLAGVIGMNGYRFVCENHDWRKETEKLERLVSGSGN